MKQPPSIPSAPRQGPAYDPMDRIVQDLENVESFLSMLALHPKDSNYLDSHLSSILGLRRTISQQLDLLSDEPYHYSGDRLKKLHQENEQVFLYLEGAVGALKPWHEKEFKKFVKAVEESLSKFDETLTP